MIFSGFVRRYRCQGCMRECSDITPTSIVPMAVVVAICAWQWIYLLVPLGEWLPLWLLPVLSFVCAILTLMLVYAALEIPSGWLLRRCRRCGGEFEHLGNGFYDGMVPDAGEVMLYLFTIATPIMLRLLF